PLPAKLPMVQYIIFDISLLYTTIKKDIIAVKNCPIAIPERSKVVIGTLFFTLAILYTISTVIIAPINAKIDIVDIPIKDILALNIIASVAPRAAPDDIPITKGSAIGFLNIP